MPVAYVVKSVVNWQVYVKQRPSRSSQQPPPKKDVLQMIANKMNNTKMNAKFPDPNPPVVHPALWYIGV